MPPGGSSEHSASAAGSGVRYEVGRARAALRRMIDAHVALAKAEIGLIADRAKVALGFIAAAVALVIFAALVATVGTPLFLGEWIFGSIGWGILHAVLFALSVAIALVMLALEVSRAWVARSLVLAAIVGVLVGAFFLFNLPHAAWAAIGDQVDAQTSVRIDGAYRPLVVAVVIGLVAGAVVGLVVGAWRGRRFSAAIGGLLGGGIAFAALCAFTAISFSVECAAGVGVAIALAIWPLFVTRPIVDGSYDWDALAARYWPGLTVETVRTTIAEVKLRLPEMPSMPRGRGGR